MCPGMIGRIDINRSETRLALAYGAICHGIFGLAGLAMVWGLYTGLSQTWGAVPWPLATLSNAILLLQFPLAHSWLLTPRGRACLARLAPAPHGETLATTTYATIASVQLLLLFTLWTPSGVVLWQATGVMFWGMSGLFLVSWVLLTKASFDAGPELQSGALGWMALAQGRAPSFPDMPTRGLFRVVRQPIYVSFALTLWTMPIRTVDQLILAIAYTSYCILAPRLKEQRFARIYGDRFRTYQTQVPYWIPGWKGRRT